ncbi:MAG: 4Fe-4S binding protein, partial [Prochlorococcaceae cyanobacterium]
CPHRPVRLPLGPPAAVLQRDSDPPAGEAGLILVLAGGVLLHHWQRLLGWLPLAPASLQAGPLLPRLAFAALALALPSLAWLGLRWLAGLQRGSTPAWRLLYALLPLLWALLLARHLPLGLEEGGQLLPVSLGRPALPAWSADPHVLAFCQSAVVLLGLAGAAVLILRLQPRGLPRWGATALVLGMAAGGRWLVAG